MMLDLISEFRLLVKDFRLKGARNYLLLGCLSRCSKTIGGLESSLFLKTKYMGDPIKAHIEVDKNNNNSISEHHFGIWLNHWFQTIDELFEGDYAQNAKRRARKMSTFLYLKIFEAR